jgi:hypothetical protein
MDRFLLFFLRLLTIAVGFFVACIVTAATILVLSRIVTPADVRAMGDNETMAGFFVGILAVATLMAYAAILPATFLVIFAEMRRMRGWLFYCLSGGLVALVYIGLVVANPQDASGPTPVFVPVAIVSGMLGGLTYWLVAGHRAGGWLPRQIKRARLERDARSDE